LRILFVIPYFYPAEFFGGPVKVAFDIGKELIKRGHEVEVYTSDAKDLTHRVDNPYAEIEGMKVHYLKNSSMFLVSQSKLFVTPDLLKTLISNLKSFDVIHVHEYTTFQNIILHKYAKKYGIPYVLQAHGSLPRINRRARKWAYDAFFGSYLLKDASKVIALNRREVKQYEERGVPVDRIEIVPNGIELSNYLDLPSRGYFRKKFDIDEDEKVILYLGRMHESKGLNLLIAAFSIILKKVNRSRLVIMGPDDGYALTLHRLISAFGIEEKVIITGFVEKLDKIAGLMDSDVFVTPRFDGFPVTFLEACLAKCPIVTTSNDLDWIDNNVGFVTKETPISFSEGVLKIIDNEMIRETLRSNCTDTVRKFDISLVTQHIEEKCYNRCIS
jgi:glycosyltransferase involved in cell wall biosynthesis